MYEAFKNWLEADARYQTFVDVMFFLDNEQVSGDVFEFGVGVGQSLASLSYCHHENLKYWYGFENDDKIKRRFVGFDTFTGLPDTEGHPRWYKGLFGRNYDNEHPQLKWDDPISPQSIYDAFDYLSLPKPTLHQGLFDAVLPQVIHQYQQAALIHIDCDLYQGTKFLLDTLVPLIQPGTFVLLDDYFCFKANPKQGEAGAFKDFLAENTEWRAIQYRQYSTYSNSFILQKN